MQTQRCVYNRYSQTHRCTQMYTHSHRQAHTCTQTRTHKLKRHADTLTHTHQTGIHRLTHKDPYPNTHTYRNTPTHTNACSGTDTQTEGHLQTHSGVRRHPLSVGRLELGYKTPPFLASAAVLVCTFYDEHVTVKTTANNKCLRVGGVLEAQGTSLVGSACGPGAAGSSSTGPARAARAPAALTQTAGPGRPPLLTPPRG